MQNLEAHLKDNEKEYERIRQRVKESPLHKLIKKENIKDECVSISPDNSRSTSDAQEYNQES